MFATPTTDSRRSEGARRSLVLRSGASGHQTRSADHQAYDETDEHNESGENEAAALGVSESGEVLTILRSIQQQVSTLQAQQAQTPPSRSPSVVASASSTNSSPVERKLPKNLTVSVG